MFFKTKKQKEEFLYDAKTQRPVIKSSICNGEKVAGFKDINTGKFEEIMCIRSQGDMEEFLNRYHLDKSQIKTEY